MFLDHLITLLLSRVHASGTMWEYSHNCSWFVPPNSNKHTLYTNHINLNTFLIKKLNSNNKDFGAVVKEYRRFQDKDTDLSFCSS